MNKTIHFRGLNGIRAIAALGVLFAQYIGKFTQDIWYNYIIVFITVFVITLFISYLSYNFFELKFIKMKDKFSSVKSRA